MIFVYALLAWFVFLPMPIVNGIFRESVLVPRLGAAVAHAASTLILVVVLIAAIYVFLDLVADDESSLTLLLLGVEWVALTLAFEFGFGRYVAKKSWDELLADYNLLKGRLWPLVPLTMLLAPVVIVSL